MSDRVNNIRLGDDYYTLNNQNSSLKTDENSDVSIFEEYSASDTQSSSEELNNAAEEESSTEDVEKQVEELSSMLSDAEDKQGIVGSAWNSFKSFIGIGSSSKKCEDAISDFKEGKISYDEAKSIISDFDSKQDSSVNMFSNIATGIVVTGVIASAVATGGLSLGVVAAAAGVGGATKAGLKFADRATNNLKGDALDGKQIVKDGLSGAVEGVATAATMGIGSAAKNVAGETAKSTLKGAIVSGAKEGAKTGGVAGAITGAGEYTINAAMDEDTDFNAAGLLKNTAANALGGAVAGGVIGGVSGGLGYAKTKNTDETALNNTENEISEKDVTKLSDKEAVEETANVENSAVAENVQAEEVTTESVTTGETSLNAERIEVEDVKAETSAQKAAETNTSAKDSKLNEEVKMELKANAQQIHSNSEKHLDEAKSRIQDLFGDAESVKDGGKITARAKSEDSIYAKLSKKYGNNKLTSTAFADSETAIGDAYGSRIQLRSVGSEEAKSIIEKGLDGTDVSYSDFINYIQGNKDVLTAAQIKELDSVSSSVVDSLKEAQTGEVVDLLVKGIDDGSITITELNNYGDDISSYFTKAQNQRIADAYAAKNPGQKLDIVTKINENSENELLQPIYDEAGELSSFVDKETGSIFNPAENGNYVSANGDECNVKGSWVKKNTDSAVYKTKGATKDSGYASSQMNVVHKFEDGSIGLGELQIRGTKLNALADAEHIPYDIRSGKITAENTKYADIYKTIKSMSKESYEQYNQYLKDCYQSIRLSELGIETELPTMDGLSFVADSAFGGGDMTEAVKLLNVQDLIDFASKSH